MRLFRAAFFVVAAATLSACNYGDKYREMSCPEHRYPTAQQFKAEASLGSILGYHHTDIRMAQTVQNEIWSDQRFDFNTSMRFYHDLSKSRETYCPAAVSIELRYPLDEKKMAAAKSFISVLSAQTKLDLSPLAATFESYAKEKKLDAPFVVDYPGYTGEVYVFHHVNRGDFLMIGLFDDWFYSNYLRAS